MGCTAEDVFPLPRQLVGDGNLFLLKVYGRQMVGAAIDDGDWVIVREQQDVRPGEIVAAMISGDATVCRAPVLATDAAIIGKVVAVLHRIA